LKSNVVLRGAGDSTIIFGSGPSVSNSYRSPAYIFGSGVSSVEVSYLQFRSTATGPGEGGRGDYRNCIQFRSSSNSAVHNILFTRYLYNDGVRIGGSSRISVYDCRMYSAGHDGVAFLSDSRNCRMYNCDVHVQTNSGVRIDNSDNCEVDHNTFSGRAGSGWCCVQLQNSLTNANVHRNIMHDFIGSGKSAGVGNVNASGSINVHRNVMWNVSPYIEIGSGIGNILGPSDHNVANWVARGYGYGSI
jgi:parallel beta-helix repeat protein